MTVNNPLPHREDAEYGEVEIQKTPNGWSIRFLGTDPDTKYLPPDPDKLKQQMKAITENNMSEKKTYKGRIVYTTNGGSSSLIGLMEGYYVPEQPLAEEIKYDRSRCGQYLTVRYYISDKEIAEDVVAEEYAKSLYGVGDVDYAVHYSETTGYLWTDEKLKVGGHNLLAELASNVGKWIVLEIEYSKTPNENAPSIRTT